MRTEDDLWAAFEELERHAPDADTVLTAVYAHAGRPAGPRWRRKGPLLVGGSLTAVALTAALAVMVATALQATTPARPGASPPGPVTPLSAREILLTAAASTEKSAAAGRYWHTSEIDGNTTDADPPHASYEITIKTRTDSWVARSPADRTWIITQQLGAGPATPDDDPAWRRAGSPTSWHTSGKSVGNADLITGGARPPVARWQPGTAQAFTEQMTRGQLDRLPADPGRLASVLRQRIMGHLVPPGTPARERAEILRVALPVKGALDGLLFNDGIALLQDPVSPQVRAATYRMLAQLPGVRAMGQVRDVLGDRGYGVAMIGPATFNGYGVIHFTEKNLLVINTATGALLAYEQFVEPAPGGTSASLLPYHAGEIFSYSAMLAQGWTNQTPSLPTTQLGPGSTVG